MACSAHDDFDRILHWTPSGHLHLKIEACGGSANQVFDRRIGSFQVSLFVLSRKLLCGHALPSSRHPRLRLCCGDIFVAPGAYVAAKIAHLGAGAPGTHQKQETNRLHSDCEAKGLLYRGRKWQVISEATSSLARMPN